MACIIIVTMFILLGSLSSPISSKTIKKRSLLQINQDLEAVDDDDELQNYTAIEAINGHNESSTHESHRITYGKELWKLMELSTTPMIFSSLENDSDFDERLADSLGMLSPHPQEEIVWEEPVWKIRDCWFVTLLSGSIADYSPSCSTSGGYTPKQCFLQRCWCVTNLGQPLKKVMIDGRKAGWEVLEWTTGIDTKMDNSYFTYGYKAIRLDCDSIVWEYNMDYLSKMDKEMRELLPETSPAEGSNITSVLDEVGTTFPAVEYLEKRTEESENLTNTHPKNENVSSLWDEIGKIVPMVNNFLTETTSEEMPTDEKETSKPVVDVQSKDWQEITTTYDTSLHTSSSEKSVQESTSAEKIEAHSETKTSSWMTTLEPCEEMKLTSNYSHREMNHFEVELQNETLTSFEEEVRENISLPRTKTTSSRTYQSPETNSSMDMPFEASQTTDMNYKTTTSNLSLSSNEESTSLNENSKGGNASSLWLNSTGSFLSLVEQLWDGTINDESVQENLAFKTKKTNLKEATSLQSETSITDSPTESLSNTANVSELLDTKISTQTYIRSSEIGPFAKTFTATGRLMKSGKWDSTVEQVSSVRSPLDQKNKYDGQSFTTLDFVAETEWVTSETEFDENHSGSGSMNE